MHFTFATCERNKALAFMQTAEPGAGLTDTPESAGPVLDLVERDVLRVQDPLMHGKQIAVIAGTKYTDDHDAEIQPAVKVLLSAVRAARSKAEP
ncbi:hypothetical protein [Pseudorhodoferax sp. Leaf265]|uniref:hypothetical protein n=1 Tax=Pseudorhodoferax sp. Leaf265 TaxID=1736315 RepID=UPI00070053FC|nr:hypothetical protein [Pseudorhodoferax sp. Leaf265]KQP02491.1 hypothetical protein ASF45_20775 [Pseudorhodoferax sp. Leaf265]